jgi:hypothetical protein
VVRSSKFGVMIADLTVTQQYRIQQVALLGNPAGSGKPFQATFHHHFGD